MSCVHSCEQSNAVDDAAAVWKWKELEIGNIILVQHKVKSIVKISKYQNIIVCSLNYNVMYCMHIQGIHVYSMHMHMHTHIKINIKYRPSKF